MLDIVNLYSIFELNQQRQNMLDILTIENLIHIRESIDRHIKTLENSDPHPASGAREVKDKKIKSLTFSRIHINQEIKDLQYEAERNPMSSVHDTDPD